MLHPKSIFVYLIFFCQLVYSQTVTDLDGNVYPTVVIGDQEWMQQNLKVTQYNNGDPIPLITDNAAWYATTTGAYAYYINDPANAATYGNLYNGFVVQDSRNVCPSGWHVPVDNEWRLLFRTICDVGDCPTIWADDMLNSGNEGSDEGGQIKETGTTHWNSPNTGATNSSGFTALAHGYRYWDGDYYTVGEYAVFWTNTEHAISVNMWFYAPYYNQEYIYHGYGDKLNGHAIRCVRPAPQSSIKEEENSLPAVYPNPSTGNITVTLNSEDYTTLHILDVSGKVCVEIKVTENTQTIDITNLNNGVYILKFTGETNTYTSKISIQN